MFFLNLPASKSNAGCSIARTRLRQNITFRNFRQLLPNNINVFFRSYDPHIFPRANTVETICRQLNQRPATSHYINKLFRTFRSAHRPKAAPYATSHYYNMIIHTCYSPVKKIFFKIGVQVTLKCPKQQIKIRVFVSSR